MKFSDKRRVILFFAYIGITLLFYVNMPVGRLGGDWYSYVNWEFSTDSLRTPGYPLLIKFCRFLFGANFLGGVELVQIIVSLISIAYMYKLLKMITDDEFMSLLLSAFYGLHPAVIGWNTMIASEALALSFTVFFIYYAVKWIKFGYKKDDAIMLGIVMFLSINVKTALFVYLLSIILIVPILFFFDGGRKVLFLLIPIAFVGVFCISWMFHVHDLSGMFSMSHLSSKHNVAIVLRDDLYRGYADSSLTTQIDEIVGNDSEAYKKESVVYEVIGLFGEDWKSQLVNSNKWAKSIIKANLSGYIRGQIIAVLNSAGNCFDFDFKYNENVGFWGLVLHALTQLFYSIKIVHVILIVLLMGIFTLTEFIKDRELKYIYLGVLGGLIVVFFSVFIGTYDSWNRTLIYILPWVTIGVALIILAIKQILCLSRSKEK